MVAICAVSDLLLILAGVTGIGTIVEQAPVGLDVVRWLGVAFLVGYGVRSLLRARRTGGAGGRPGRGSVARAAAVTARWR